MISKYIANEEWMNIISQIMEKGRDENCRGYKIKELLGCISTIPMSLPIITIKKRELGYKFMMAEAAWILSGDNRVKTIRPYSKMIDKFSDDDITFFGAYGPPIVDQLEYINRTLTKDIFSRQAVLTIWRQKPPVSNDIPCTLSIQFIVRMENGELTLHLFDNMRSSDAWLGVPYDWFNFSMLAAYMAIYLRKTTGIELKLGNLFFYTGSQHLYRSSFGYRLSDVENVIESGVYGQETFYYEPINLKEFSEPDELVTHLWNLAMLQRGLPGKKWLKELQLYWENKNANKKINQG